MILLPESIENYIEEHSSKEDEILHQLYRETHLKIMHPRMLSGAVQGQFLQMLAAVSNAKSILEIGTYTGYSAICLGRGMSKHGHIDTIDIKEELFEMALKYFIKAGLDQKITQHIGNAIDIIPKMNKRFDLIFIDADKNNYPHYFDLVIDLLEEGGLLIADNVLWSGKVVEDLAQDDLDTKGLLEFNKKVSAHPQLQKVLIPLRDGLMLARKQSS